MQFIRKTCCAILVAGTCVFGAKAFATDAGPLVFVVGDVSVIGSDGKTRPARVGETLGAGESLRTGNGGMAQMQMSDGSTLSTTFGSQFSVSGGALNIAAGQVERLGGHDALVIRTPDATITNNGSVMVGVGKGETGYFGISGSTTVADANGKATEFSGFGSGRVDAQGASGARDPGKSATAPAGLPANVASNSGQQNSTPPGVQQQVVGAIQGGSSAAVASGVAGGGAAVDGGAAVGGAAAGGVSTFPTIMTATTINGGGAGYRSTIGPTGSLLSADSFYITAGTMAEQGSDGSGVSWGRYATTTTEFRDPAITPYPTGTQKDVAWVTGSLLANMPTSGTVNYTQVGATLPTMEDGTTGTLNSASLSVNFSTQKVSAAVSATVGGTTIAATGGVMNLVTGNGQYQASGNFSGNVGITNVGETAFNVSCTGTCGAAKQAMIAGGLMGNGAAAAGLVYQLSTGAAGAGGYVDSDSSSYKSFSGAVAFKK